MKIGGLQKLSLLDYPDYPSAIVFTQGCNFRCQFCYNPMLVWPYGGGKFKKDHCLLEENDLFDFLKSRVGKLEGVVITGGEPTIHKDLPELIKKIKALGFKIKLDTNGTNPKMLAKFLTAPLIRKGGRAIDYIAMDLKAPLEKYEEIAGAPADLKKIKESIKIILASDLPHEFRTTVIPDFITKNDILKMGELIMGADKWFLQFFKSDLDLVNEKLRGKKPYAEKKMEEMARIGKKFAKKCQIR
jgi:pyruvate formate lyase activating enzyme